MPRPLRILPAGCVAHARNRGNDKKVLFDSTRDFEHFLWLVAWAKQQCPIRIVAYCLMTNHWHFVLWPATNDAVELFMHRLSTTHAAHRRQITRTVGYGHIYQDRYRASVINSEAYYWNALRYVEANPLRAGLVKAAERWRWSSLYERLGHSRDILDAGPFALPNDWGDRVNEALPESTITEIRNELWKR